MKKTSFKIIALLTVASTFYFFQNCAKVNFMQRDDSDTEISSNTNSEENTESAQSENTLIAGPSSGDGYSGKVKRYVQLSALDECEPGIVIRSEIRQYDEVYQIEREDCVDITPEAIDPSEISKVDDDHITYQGRGYSRNLPASCNEIFQLGGAAGNGFYLIDQDGSGSQPAAEVFCDMELISGGWTPWSHWSPCSLPCDGGVQTRNRTCLADSCSGIDTETQSCNERACN